jgi:hypothetical protein
MTDNELTQYSRLETFEARREFVLKRAGPLQPLPPNELDWDYEKQNSYTNAELGE